MTQSASSAAVEDSIDHKFVHVVAQTLPESAPLSAPVAQALADDAEYHLRHVLQIAISFMNHSKTNVLSVSHVASALALVTGRQSYGFRKQREFHTLGFASVAGCNGLYVPKDEVLPLERFYAQPLPAARSSPALTAEWIMQNGSELQEMCAPSINVTSANALLGILRIVIDTDEEEYVEDALRTLSSMGEAAINIVPLLDHLVGIVHANARPKGETATLTRAMRALYALLCNPRHGIECHLDRVAPCILTCLLGQSLGSGDTQGLRELAADVLHAALSSFPDAVFRARTIKTLAAVLTDSETTMPSLYGALLGLAAAGQEVCNIMVHPHLPALLRGLEAALAAAETVQHPVAGEVKEWIGCVCEAIALATGASTVPVDSIGASDALPV